MTSNDPSGQLELFDVTSAQRPGLRPRSLGRRIIQLRDDQLVLVGIAGLIGSTLVFASGVERGKQLVRAQQSSRARQDATVPLSVPPKTTVAPPASAKPAAPSPAEAGKSQPAPATSPAKKTAGKLASETATGTSRYAVQIVSYRRPQLAQQELSRLHASGERAFLVMREGYTVLYVGPFPSKDNAKAKLSQLKVRYQGCFVKTL